MQTMQGQSLLTQELYWATLESPWDKEDRTKNIANLVGFLDLIIDYKTSVTLIEYIKYFRLLPEYHWSSRPINDLTQKAQQFFKYIEQDTHLQPLDKLKLSVVLLCHQAVYYEDTLFSKTLEKMMNDSFLLLESIPLKQRLEICIICFNQWPLIARYSSEKYSNDILFSKALPELFIQYAKHESSHAFELFESTFPKHYNYFISSSENRYLFIQFISNYIKQQPERYVVTLLEYLEDYKSYRFPEEKIRDISRKLYEITNNSEFSDLLNANHQKYLKRIYATLLKKAYPDESWYSLLGYKLWEIEADCLEITEISLDYYCILILNTPNDFPYIDAICEKYISWVKGYVNIPSVDKLTLLLKDTDPFDGCYPYYSNNLYCQCNNLYCQCKFYMLQKYTGRIIKPIIYSLYDYTSSYRDSHRYYRSFHRYYRNNYMPLTDISNNTQTFIDKMVEAYYEMCDWLLENNFVGLFYALKETIENGSYKEYYDEDASYENKIVDGLVIKAEEIFLKYIEKLVTHYPNESINLIRDLIDISQYGSRERIHRLLDKLFPIIIELNPDIAVAGLQAGANRHQNDRYYIWKPNDYPKNPIFRQVRWPNVCI